MSASTCCVEAEVSTVSEATEDMVRLLPVREDEWTNPNVLSNRTVPLGATPLRDMQVTRIVDSVRVKVKQKMCGSNHRMAGWYRPAALWHPVQCPFALG